MSEIISTIMDNLIVPGILVIAGVLITIIQKFLTRIAKSIEIRDEMATIEKQVSIRNKLIEILNDIVKTAVANNMQLADEWKKDGHKLSEEQQKQLKETAVSLVYAALPSNLKDNGPLLEIIGGKDILNILIESLIEKFVYEYKIAKNGED